MTKLKSIKHVSFIMVILCIWYNSSFATESEGLFDLSFEELMSTKVKIGSLLYMTNYDKPAMVTTITSEDIRVTPHRNIYDLIETYIPGALYMNHYDAPTLGIRGIISDRNNKILLLINGQVSNQKARTGAIAELQNWDLGDIDKIEIIRGPGSSTYGPGAIAGVINIITKTKSTNDANDIRINYVYPYNSLGVSAKLTQHITDDISLFGYASLQQTKGYEPENAYVMMYNGWTKEFHNEFNNYQDYLGDYFGEPQRKIHLQLDIFENTKLWMRYSNLGSTTNGAVHKSEYQIGIDTNNQIIMGSLSNPLQVKYEHFIINLENEYKFDENYTLNSIISYSTENNARTMGWYWMWGNEDSPPTDVYEQLIDHKSIRNKYNNFSESEICGNLLIRGVLSDAFRFAFGSTISYNKWGAPWFEDEKMIRMGDYSNIISGPDSPVYGSSLYFGVDSGSAIFVGDGWSTMTHSFYGEAELKLDESLKLLVSSRLDKNTYSKYLFSPRFALIYNLSEQSSIKMIAQQSNRMNTAEELFLENRAGKISPPEKLNTIEMIYSSIIGDKLFFESSLFYNSIDILSWNDPDRTTRTTGSLSILGWEAELRYNTKYFGIGLNHSFTLLLDWKLADNIFRSGISYSDYYYNYKGNELYGIGNNLNNWANNSTKLYSNFYFFKKKLVFHVNARILWGFEGASDGLDFVEQLVAGTEDEEQINGILQVMRENDFYGLDFRLNASANYRVFSNTVVAVQMMNITKLGNNYRYKYDAGNKADTYFFRMNLLEEPFTVRIHLAYEL